MPARRFPPPWSDDHATTCFTAAVALVPAKTAVLPGLGLWPSAHPFGRRGPPAFP